MLSRTTIWRLRHRTAGISECVVRQRRDGRSSLCIIGGDEPTLEVFGSASTAMRRARQIGDSMIEAGWRDVAAGRSRRTVAGSRSGRRRLRPVSPAHRDRRV